MNEPVTQLVVNDRRTERDAPARVNTLPSNPLEMLAVAQQRGAGIEELKQFMELQERWEKNEARKAYVKAMAAFKAEPHEILKRKYVDIPGGAKFHHATLADVVDGVVASLARHGLSHKWITEQSEKNIKVTCIITHELGHSESTEMVGAPDDGGKKNAIQSVGSTVTYLQRYTLMAICGLAAKDMDNDGKGAAAPKKPEEPAPNGYEDWKADMTALADEGLQRLTDDGWAKASPAVRRYVVKFDEDWWIDLKRKAGKVKVQS